MQIVSDERARYMRCWRDISQLCKGSNCMGWDWSTEYNMELKARETSTVNGFCAVNPK